MTRLLAVSTAVLALTSGCGGTSAPPGAAGTPRVTEASIQFESPVSIEDALAICRRHDVRATQLVSHTLRGGESFTAGVMVDPGMDEEAIATRFREGGVSATVLVNQMFATGDADALQSLKEERLVETVFLKPPSATLTR